MNLVLDVAFTHVRSRARQTLVAVAGVCTLNRKDRVVRSVLSGSLSQTMPGGGARIAT